MDRQPSLAPPSSHRLVSESKRLGWRYPRPALVEQWERCCVPQVLVSSKAAGTEPIVGLSRLFDSCCHPALMTWEVASERRTGI